MRKIIDKTYNSKCRDPFILKHDGKFYHCFTEDQKTVSIACANRVEELATATAKVVFMPEKNKEYSKDVWAPELHVIDGKSYIYLACDDGENYHHRMFVLTNNSKKPLCIFSSAQRFFVFFLGNVAQNIYKKQENQVFY